MKSKWSIGLLAALLLVACEPLEVGSEPVPEPEVDPPVVEPVAVLNDRIDDGRHATAYVTYYGSLIPDAAVLTHINYAFAELYMVDGIYQGFKVQGNLSRFESIAALKKTNPGLKICLSFTHGVSNSDNKQGGSFSGLCKSESNRGLPGFPEQIWPGRC